MKLPSKVKFIDEKLRETFESLKIGKSEEKELYEWLESAFKDIEENAFCGKSNVPQSI